MKKPDYGTSIKKFTDSGILSFYVPIGERQFIALCKIFADSYFDNFSSFIIATLRLYINNLTEDKKVKFNESLTKLMDITKTADAMEILKEKE